VIHLLVVDRDGAGLDAPPSFEVLRARTGDEAVEKLARNRRIDAVLFADDVAARETIELLDRDGSGSPPLFRAGPSGIEGVTGLDPDDLFRELSDRLGE
jgi:hypothetical protein